MTYQEAAKFANENWETLQPRMVNSIPAHLIQKHIIAPEYSNLNTLSTILALMEDNGLSNEAVLEQMNLLGNNLIVYVVYLTQGYTVVLPISVYNSILWVKEGSGNRS